MGVIAVGLSHKTAPIELRERLSIPQHKLGDALDELIGTRALKEAVVLSTCNRLEVYARPAESGAQSSQAIAAFFHRMYNSPKLKEAIYQHESKAAVHHLFRVASGLESMVVGETDVLGQVKSSYQFAHQHGTTGKITNVLFQRALFVGKTVRTQTEISEGSSSVGAVAVQLAERIFGQLHHRRLLLVGAGKIAEVTARHLLSQKAEHLVVLNRTLSKAYELARLLNGEAGSLEQLDAELVKADIVICSTAAQKPFITKERMESLLKWRDMRSLYFIDIAVPRNVESTVHDLDNVYVYNIDDLKALVEENLNQRRTHLGAAARLVESMADEFYDWVRATMDGRPQPLRHTPHHAN